MATTTVEPGAAAPGPKTNRIGLDRHRLQGRQDHAVRRLRPQRDFRAHHRRDVRDGRRARAGHQAQSGIGCSSKSPAYFLSRSHSFNAVHGRMPSVATGAMLANRKLIGIGVSGDGDTASIGIGQFVHLMRRNLPIIYIIEDNGVYGLTKGQFSATADLGSKLKIRRIERPAADRHLRAGDRTGRDVRWHARSPATSASCSAMLKAAIAHKRHGHARRGFALRDLQRSRGIDQDLTSM